MVFKNLNILDIIFSKNDIQQKFSEKNKRKTERFGLVSDD